MSITRHNCIAYRGKLRDIPKDASPGLLFLKEYLTSLHDLASPRGAHKFTSPLGVVKNNAAAPVLTKTEPNLPEIGAAKRAKRIAALKSVTVELERAWDIEYEDGKRVVLYDVILRHVFNADPTEEEVIMPESAAMELDKVPAGETERGYGGYWATELRSKHDRTPILNKRKELGC
jgi:hypothetical protein